MISLHPYGKASDIQCLPNGAEPRIFLLLYYLVCRDPSVLFHPAKADRKVGVSMLQLVWNVSEIKRSRWVMSPFRVYFSYYRVICGRRQRLLTCATRSDRTTPHTIRSKSTLPGVRDAEAPLLSRSRVTMNCDIKHISDLLLFNVQISQTRAQCSTSGHLPSPSSGPAWHILGSADETCSYPVVLYQVTY